MKHDWARDAAGEYLWQEIHIPEAPEENYHSNVQCLLCGKWSGCINCQEETLETDCEGEED